MKKINTLISIFCGISFFPVNAATIDFEDLTTRSNFTSLGITNNYKGFEWGYGNGAGVNFRNFADSSTGWASATIGNPGDTAAPDNMSGFSYARIGTGPKAFG